MNSEQPENKNPKKFRAAIFAEGKLIKIVSANSDESRAILMDEHRALGYTVEKGFIRVHKEKLVWIEESVRSRLIEKHGVPITNSVVSS